MGLAMGIYAGIAAGGVMVLLVLISVLGWLFSSDKKKKAAQAQIDEEKGEFVGQKSGVVVQVSQHEVGGLHNAPSSQFTPTSQLSSKTDLVR
jgi:cbb3-type cytochrome oxidase subunit 3